MLQKEKILEWNVKSNGMEFASEMLVRAMTTNSKIVHVPVTLYPDHKDRKPHLRTWTDGMKHLLQILLPASKFFFINGAVIFFISWLIMLLGLLVGPVQIGMFGILGIHSMMFVLLGSVLGLTIIGLGLFLAVSQGTEVRFYNYLINLEENKVFWISFLITIVGIVLFLKIFIQWGIFDFKELALEKETLTLIALSINFVQFVFIILTAHLIKRT